MMIFSMLPVWMPTFLQGDCSLLVLCSRKTCAANVGLASNWCPHLRNAARKAGLKVKESPVYLKNLTQMRKNQRADKSKSGRKQPRKFDLIPIHEMYNDEESEDILLNLAASNPSLPRSNVDDTIEWVIAQAYALQIPNPDEPGNPIPVAAQSGDRTVQPEQEQVETSETRNPDTAVSEPLFM